RSQLPDSGQAMFGAEFAEAVIAEDGAVFDMRLNGLPGGLWGDKVGSYSSYPANTAHQNFVPSWASARPKPAWVKFRLRILARWPEEFIQSCTASCSDRWPIAMFSPAVWKPNFMIFPTLECFRLYLRAIHSAWSWAYWFSC